MSEEKEEGNLTPAYGVRTAVFIVENGYFFKNLVINVVGELSALSELIRTENEFIFLIKLKNCDSGSSSVVVNVVVDECLTLHKELSSCFHAEILLENLSATMVKYKGGSSPLCVLKASPASAFHAYNRKLVKYINHKEFLAQIDGSRIKQLQTIDIPVFGEGDNCCKKDIISYKGMVTSVLDADGGIYELDGKVTLYLTRLFLQPKYVELSYNDSIVLHNVHALRISSKINLVCCGLSFVEVLNGPLDDSLCPLGTPVSSAVLWFIQRLALNFSEVEWLLTSVRCLNRNLCPSYLPSDWLHEVPLNQNRSSGEKSFFAELFPPLLFGKNEFDIAHPHSAVEDFCSFPHCCTFVTKPSLFSPVVQYLSLMELREHAVNKAVAVFGTAASTWKHFSLHNSDFRPKMIIVGLLTASTKNGKLCIRDNSGILECVVATSLHQNNCWDVLKPSNLDRVIKISDYSVIMEQFQSDDHAVLEPASPQVHHKVYVSFNLKDVVYLQKSAKIGASLLSQKPRSDDGAITGLAQQMSSLTLDQSFGSSTVLLSDKLTENPLQSSCNSSLVHNVSKSDAAALQPPFQHSATLDAKSSRVFRIARKSPVRFNYKKGFNFEVQVLVIDALAEAVPLEPSSKKATDMTGTIKSASREKTLLERITCSREKGSDGPKVIKHVQLVFSGPAVKFFHVLHKDCVYRARLSSSQLQDIARILSHSAASIVPCMINITHLDELECLDGMMDDKFLMDKDQEYDDNRILSVEEALSKNSFEELISLFGVIAKREQFPSQKGFGAAALTYFDEEFFKMGIGNWQNEVIQLEVRDLISELASTRVYLDVGNSMYPLRLLPGALVKLTSMNGQISRSNHLYFRSTAVTCVDVLEHSSISATKSSSSTSLLAEYLASERLLFSENLAKWESSSFCKFLCLADIQHIWNVELHLTCADCKETIEGNSCACFGCHCNAASVDKTTLSFLASDGSACATVRCQGDNARQILQMREDDWRTLLTSSGIRKAWRNDISKDKNCIPNDVGSRILRSATTRPSVYRPVLMELEWKKSNSWPSAVQPKGKVSSPRLFCTRLEEVTYLSAISCYLGQ